MKRLGLALGALLLCFSKVQAEELQQGLKVGSPAPEFWAPASDDTKVQLSEWLNRAPIVIFFYPKDDNRAGMAEIRNFSENYSGFHDLKATVFGISYDSVSTHKKFVKKYHVPFVLLSDQFHAVAKSYGVSGLLSASMATFVIDKRGNISYINRDVNPATQGLELQNILAQL